MAYLLQGEQTEQIWGQNIDGEGEKDLYPVFSDDVVYAVKNSEGEIICYSNSVYGPPHTHSYDNGFCSVCDGYEPATGSGTESDPYKIGNAGQLYWFAAVVNGGYGDVAQNLAACAELTANITVNTGVLAEDGTLNSDGSGFRKWTPIGPDYNIQYEGTFDGKGFTVSGLYFNNSSANYVGLFGSVENGTVQNVGVVDSYLSGSDYVGGVVGSNSGIVTDSYNEGTVSGSGDYYVGGMVGANYGTVTNCYNTGAVSGDEGDDYSGAWYIGGVVGFNSGSMEDCYNTGAVSGDESVGGVVGVNYKGTVANCYNAGTISGGSTVGGVVGHNCDGSVAICYNTGAVSGIGNVGGVVGDNYAGNYDSTVRNCYNAGTVSGSDYVGGVVGVNHYGTVTDCYNAGAVSGDESVGGVVGKNYEGIVANCYNAGTVSSRSSSYVGGGVIGTNTGAVHNCYYLAGTAAGGIDGADMAGQAEARSARKFVSGEVAYLLQGDRSEQLWGQNIDGDGVRDPYPVFSGDTVYGEKNCAGTVLGYTNTQTVQPDHTCEAVITEPACTEGGYTTYICSACGHSYVGDEVDALGHSEAIDPGQAPTCTEEGLTDGKHCSVCNEVLNAQETIDALGHSYEAVVTAPTCIEGGYTTYTCACGESYISDEVASLGHSYVDGVCTGCGTLENPLIVNVETGKSYATLEEALADAQKGQTVKLMADVTWSGELKAVKLDLNGFVLTVDRHLVAFKDAHILDSSASNSGFLFLEEAAEDYLILPKTNEQLPVYGNRIGMEDTRMGYSFVKVERFNSSLREDKKDFVFQPFFEASACEGLKAGYDVSQVQVIVRVSWINDNGEKRKQDFVYNDDLVKGFAGSYKPADNRYGNMFTLKLSVTDLERYSFQILVISDTDVTIAADPVSLPPKEQ